MSVILTAQAPLSAYVLSSTQSKLGTTLAAKVNTSGIPLAPVARDVITGNLPTVAVTVTPTPYIPFILCSDGSLSVTKSSDKFIVGPAPGTTYYVPDGVHVAPDVQVPTLAPNVPPYTPPLVDLSSLNTNQ